MILNLLEEYSILTENEIRHEVSHINFLEKTLNGLKESVNCLRFVRNQKMLSPKNSQFYDEKSQNNTNRYSKTTRFYRRSDFRSGDIKIRDGNLSRKNIGIQDILLKSKGKEKKRVIRDYSDANFKSKHNHELKSIKSMDRIFSKNKEYLDFGDNQGIGNLNMYDSRGKNELVRSGYKSSRLRKNKNLNNFFTSRDKNNKFEFENNKRRQGSIAASTQNLKSISMKYLQNRPKMRQKEPLLDLKEEQFHRQSHLRRTKEERDISPTSKSKFY